MPIGHDPAGLDRCAHAAGGDAAGRRGPRGHRAARHNRAGTSTAALWITSREGKQPRFSDVSHGMAVVRLRRQRKVRDNSRVSCECPLNSRFAATS